MKILIVSYGWFSKIQSQLRFHCAQQEEGTYSLTSGFFKAQTAIVSKATRTLNFLKHNLSNCSREVKESAYLTMVRPQMEYASAVWDPYYNSHIQQLEKIQ